MASSSTDRRGLLKTGATGATRAYPSPGDQLVRPDGGAPSHGCRCEWPSQFSPALSGRTRFPYHSKIADLVIPRTSTPGALDACVPEYIDRVVGSDGEHQSLVRIAWDGSTLGWKHATARPGPRDPEFTLTQLISNQRRRIEHAGIWPGIRV